MEGSAGMFFYHSYIGYVAFSFKGDSTRKVYGFLAP